MGESVSGSLLLAYLAVACPSILYVLVQKAGDPKGSMRSLFPPVDSSVDLSFERFHSVLSTNLEAQAHACLCLSPALLVPLILAAYSPFAAAGRIRLILRAGLGLIGGSAVLHVLFILFGAPLVDAWEKTLSLSAFLASVTTVPLACVLGKDVKRWCKLLSFSQPQTVAEVMAYIPAAGAMVGTWVGAFPIPLDWDRPWQAWPITCAGGAASGHLAGLLVALGVLLVRGKRYESVGRTAGGKGE